MAKALGEMAAECDIRSELSCWDSLWFISFLQKLNSWMALIDIVLQFVRSNNRSIDRSIDRHSACEPAKPHVNDEGGILHGRTVGGLLCVDGSCRGGQSIGNAWRTSTNEDLVDESRRMRSSAFRGIQVPMTIWPWSHGWPHTALRGCNGCDTTPLEPSTHNIARRFSLWDVLHVASMTTTDFSGWRLPLGSQCLRRSSNKYTQQANCRLMQWDLLDPQFGFPEISVVRNKLLLRCVGVVVLLMIDCCSRCNWLLLQVQLIAAPGGRVLNSRASKKWLADLQ
jgi:hypothetical protein